MRGCNAHREKIVHQRRGNRTAKDKLIVGFGIAGAGAGFKAVARLTGDDVDRAAKRILAVQRTLRPAKDLYAFDIQQRVVEIAGIGSVNAIDKQADARLNRLHQRDTHTANGDERTPAAVAVDIETRRQCSGLTYRIDATRRQHIAIDRRGGNRHVLQRFLALAGGDHDGVADRILCRHGIVRHLAGGGGSIVTERGLCTRLDG